MQTGQAVGQPGYRINRSIKLDVLYEHCVEIPHKDLSLAIKLSPKLALILKPLFIELY
jgi:hypothetical protein